MPTNLMAKIYSKTDAALASGDLQPLQTEQVIVIDQGIRFVLRWASTLANKDAATKKPTATAQAEDNIILPGGPRDPDFNPFLKPDPALLVGDIGPEHAVILNKFPVCLHHLVIARKDFAEQQSPLELSDFFALANIMSNYGGLGFYNGGAAAGASQRHKHVQWLPAKIENASLSPWLKGLPKNPTVGETYQNLALAIQHCFIPVNAGIDTDIAKSTESMLQAYKQGLNYLGLQLQENGLLPAFNMLVSDGWMLIVPRTREHFDGISLNSTSFGGTIYVREKSQIHDIEQQGPLSVLASVGIK